MESIFSAEQSQLIQELCNAIAEHRSSGLKRFPAELKSRIVDLARQGVSLQLLAQRLQLQPSQLQGWLRSEKSVEEISVFEVSDSSADSGIRIPICQQVLRHKFR
jgi:hypothetical protein